MAELEQIDYFSEPSTILDPYPYWDFARAHGPVWREPHHGVAMVTGYDEVIAVYHDHHTWSACNSVSGWKFPVPLAGDDVSDLIEAHRDELVFSGELPTMDPPQHTEHRGLLLRLITPKRLKENEEFMWRWTDVQLDEILDRDRCELVKDFARPLTAVIIAELLGVPEADRPHFRDEMVGKKQASYASVGGVDALTSDPFAWMHDAFTDYVEDRRREPRDDVLTALAVATFPDGTLPEVHEVVTIAANLFGAGQETTVHLLSASVRRLAEDPDVQAALRADPDRIPNFVEEVLRFDSPLKGPFRLSRVPTTVGGVELPAGTTAKVFVGAANRDPHKFECPNEFRPDRANARQHLAFGHGIHTCVGAPLARSEARIALERLLDRTTDIRISEEHHGPPDARRYDYRPTELIRGMLSLHLEYTPTGAGRASA
jgi:cytochrome P450